MSQEKKLDRRAQRTRRALREALIALILQKGYGTITVQEITDRADLNRGTLYLHYRDKQDLLLESSNDVYNNLLAQFAPITPENLAIDVPEGHLTIVFQHVAANADFYRVMMGEHGVAAFVARLRHLVTEVGLGRLTVLRQLAPGQHIPSDLIASHAGGAIIGVIEWWLENDMQLPPETMAQYTLELTVNGLYKTIGLDTVPIGVLEKRDRKEDS
jgi:AcrR family transcriptional regulator